MSDHDHEHDEFHEPTDSEVRAKAVESLLAEKGLLSTDAVDEIVNQYENDVGPHERRASRCPCMDRPRIQDAVSWQTAEMRSPSWATATSTARGWWSSRTP